MIYGVLSLVVMLLFCGASFFFALSETALFALGNWRVKLLAEKHVRGARLEELMRNRDDLLATIVLGNTVANAGVVAIGLGAVYQGLWSVKLGWAVLGLAVLILFGCEVVPKTLAVRVPEFWALRIVEPMALLVRVSLPLRRVAQGVNAWLMKVLVPKSVTRMGPLTEAEYRELLELGLLSGSLKKSEKEIIQEILRLDRRTVKEVMRPRSRVDMIPDDLDVEVMIREARRLKHQRLPLYDEATDTIVGVLNTRVLLSDPNHDIAEAIEFPSFVPESMNLLQLWRSLRRQQRGIAIVMDEYGGVAGILTVEDILESVLGQIRGEGETQEFMLERVGVGKWRVNGLMRLDDFEREYAGMGEVAEVETLGGLLTTQLGAIPARGETVVFRGLRLTATVVDERRVRELTVELVKKL